MPVGWQFFRIICVLQMMASVYFFFGNLIGFFNFGRGVHLLQALAFSLIATFSIFALNLLNSNYPDRPIMGRQKSTFNWLFLFNFLLLALLFAYFFSAFRLLQFIASTFNREIFDLPVRIWWPVILYTSVLIFQFVLLYGLYFLRRMLFINHVSKQQFEFEGQ